MNKFLFLFLLIGVNHQFSWSQHMCGDLVYKQIQNLDMQVVEYYSLKFDNNVSISREINMKKENDSSSVETNEIGSSKIRVIGRKNLDPKFYYNSSEDFYFKDIFFDESLVVKEEVNEWHWNLLDETKEIGNFLCQKATIAFRGRNYIAWFTNKIPVTFGPWKFQGLPGLILEVYDENYIFHIKTTDIKINKCTLESKIEFSPKDIDKSMSLSMYLEKKEQLVNEMFAMTSSKMPKGTPTLKWDKECEDCSKEIEIFE